MKTRAEVEELKRQWTNDPCWELREEEGYDEYWAELSQFQKDYYYKREQEPEKEKQREKEIWITQKVNCLGPYVLMGLLSSLNGVNRHQWGKLMIEYSEPMALALYDYEYKEQK